MKTNKNVFGTLLPLWTTDYSISSFPLLPNYSKCCLLSQLPCVTIHALLNISFWFPFQTINSNYSLHNWTFLNWQLQSPSQFLILSDLSAMYNWTLLLVDIISLSLHDCPLSWWFSYICNLFFSALCPWLSLFSLSPTMAGHQVLHSALLSSHHPFSLRDLIYPHNLTIIHTTDSTSDHCSKFHFQFSKCIVDISTWMFKWHIETDRAKSELMVTSIKRVQCND